MTPNKNVQTVDSGYNGGRNSGVYKGNGTAGAQQSASPAIDRKDMVNQLINAMGTVNQAMPSTTPPTSRSNGATPVGNAVPSFTDWQNKQRIESPLSAIDWVMQSENSGEDNYRASKSDAEKEGGYTQSPNSPTTGSPTALPGGNTNPGGGNTNPGGGNGNKAKNGGGVGGGSYSTAAPTEEVPADEKATMEYTPPAATQVLDTTPPDIQKVGYYDTSTLANTLNASLQAAQQQANASIDYGVETGVNALNRALEDAQQSYQTERNQVAYDERTAMDNQALYNQARGDNGGVGQSQYNSIQNTAAQNRLAINNEQTRIAADTAQQIADLRAQGEFDKADKMLELTQDYLSKLMSIEQWGAQYNLSVDQINQAIDQWKAEYEQNAKQINANYAMNEAGLTGYYKGVPLYENAAKLVSTLAEYGIAPDIEALMRLGYSQREAEALASKVVPEPVNTGSGGGGTVKEYMESRIRQYQRQGYQNEDALSAAATDAKARFSGAEQTIVAIGDDWMR